MPLQDLPPQEGFAAIKYKRYLPKRGPSGLLLLSGAFVLMGYGWIHVKRGNDERRELRNEQVWSRIHLVPLLQAETDRDMARRLQFSLKERVPGIGVDGYDPQQAEPVYYTQRHVSPSLVLLDKEQVVPAQWWRGSKVLTRNPAYHERQGI